MAGKEGGIFCYVIVVVSIGVMVCILLFSVVQAERVRCLQQWTRSETAVMECRPEMEGGSFWGMRNGEWKLGTAGPEKAMIVRSQTCLGVGVPSDLWGEYCG